MDFEDGRTNLEEYDEAVRIRIMAAQIHAMNGISTWCFWSNAEGDHHFSTCVHEQQYYSFLELGGGLNFVENEKSGFDRPAVLSDSLGLTWLAEHTFVNGSKALLFVLGPVFLGSTPLRYIEDALSKRIYSTQTRLQMIRMMADIPVISPSNLILLGKMLHYTLKNEKIRSEDFICQNDLAPKLSETEDPPLIRDPAYDRVRQGESKLLDAVRDGNTRYREILEQELSYYEGYLSHTGDELRDGKNSVIVITALCSHAAMEGGLSARAATKTEVQYYSEIEACQSISALKNVMNRMLEEFVTRVARTNEDALLSREIRNCCDYIRVNVTKELTVEGIAAEMGYTPYYLSRKFSKEMGIKINDYIKQAKVEAAKVALMTGGMSVQEISDMLHFGSRNYFTRVFSAYTGMTPAAFRKRSGGGTA